MPMNNSKLESIIFDLGGVLLNLDYSLTIKAFEKLGIKDAENHFSQKSQTSFFDDFEKGKIPASKFRNEIRKTLVNPISDTEIDRAWNSLLLDFPPERFDLLKSLSNKYRIFLLSNTNEIHMAWFKKYINQLFGENVFFNLFEIAYLSNEMGMRKPDKEIFEFVTSENNLNPETTLFIDDSPQHLVGAKSAGLQTIWLEKNMEITKILQDY